MAMSQGQDRQGGGEVGGGGERWSRGLLSKTEAKGSLDNWTHEAPVACGNTSGCSRNTKHTGGGMITV